MCRVDKIGRVTRPGPAGTSATTSRWWTARAWAPGARATAPPPRTRWPPATRATSRAASRCWRRSPTCAATTRTGRSGTAARARVARARCGGAPGTCRRGACCSRTARPTRARRRATRSRSPARSSPPARSTRTTYTRTKDITSRNLPFTYTKRWSTSSTNASAPWSSPTGTPAWRDSSLSGISWARGHLVTLLST